jgi:hypothetical protein
MKDDTLLTILSGLTLVAVALSRRIVSKRHEQLLRSLADEMNSIDDLRREIELLRSIVCRADDARIDRSSTSIVERPTTSEQG